MSSVVLVQKDSTGDTDTRTGNDENDNKRKPAAEKIGSPRARDYHSNPQKYQKHRKESHFFTSRISTRMTLSPGCK